MTDTLDLEVDGPDVECNFKGASDFKGGCSCDTSDFNGGRFEDRSEDRSGFEVGFSDDTTDYLNGGKFTLLLVLNYYYFMCCHIM